MAFKKGVGKNRLEHIFGNAVVTGGAR